MMKNRMQVSLYLQHFIIIPFLFLFFVVGGGEEEDFM